MLVKALTRTDSESSISTLDADAQSSDTVVESSDYTGNSKRARKRFTNEQLIMLELLYRQTSHPSRDERDAVAKEGNMETRAVTVWFQNKRQTERRGSRNSTNRTASSPFSDTPGKTIHTASRPTLVPLPPLLPGSDPDDTPSPSSTPSTSDNVRTSTPTSMPASRPAEASISTHINTNTTTPRQRPELAPRKPSLDSIAARAERAPPPPQTPPTKRTFSWLRTPPRRTGPLWQNMPSSPSAPAPGGSPDRQADRVLIDYGRRVKRVRTLEWACAAARVGGGGGEKEKDDGWRSREGALTDPESDAGLVLDLGGDTEDEGEVHEAVTPKSDRPLRGARVLARRWTEPVDQDASKENEPIRVASPDGNMPSLLKEVGVETRSEHGHDEDTMKAALALCGLGLGLGKQ